MAETVSRPYWLIFVMGFWLVAYLGLGAKAVFYDAEKADQFED
jgi:hypothetical protein